jgi:toxin ParE1/3/4
LALLEFTGPALLDLVSLRSYVATGSNSEFRAQAFIERIKQRCEMLVTFPNAGRLRPEFLPDTRSLAIRPIVVFYRHIKRTDTVRIERIVDGRRDLGTIFAEDV